MKLDRYFYSISAAVFVLLTFWGFHSFYLYGKAAGGNPIAPGMFVLDSIHGASISAWFLLFQVLDRQLLTSFEFLTLGIVKGVGFAHRNSDK